MDAWLVDGVIDPATADGRALDRGLEFGDGLFETMAVVAGRPRLLSRHLDRLFFGCERLGLRAPARDGLAAEIETLAATPGAAFVKLILTRGAGGTGYACPAHTTARRYLRAFASRRPARPIGSAVRVARLPDPLGGSVRLAGLKHLNRLEQVLYRRDLDALGLDEGLVTDASGHLVSGAMSNVFVVRRGVVATPDLAQAGIAGVMRGALIDVLRSQGVPVEIRPVHYAECAEADELFLTNALIGLWSVTELDGRTLPPAVTAHTLQPAIASW